jgi:hypothetical protein
MFSLQRQYKLLRCAGGVVGTSGMQDMFLEQFKGILPLGLLNKTLRSKITTIITRVEERRFGQELVRPRVRLDVKVNLRKPERIRHIVYPSTSFPKKNPF